MKITTAACILLSCLMFSCGSKDKNTLAEIAAPTTIENVDQYVTQLMDRQGIPGIALAIVKEGQIIHKKNYGQANIEHDVRVSDASIFRLYSLTKPFVAVGIFQLVEEGKISLDDSIGKYVPGLPPNWNAIQIKHLLSHSAGLPDMAPLSDFKELSEEEAKEKIFAQDLRFKAGAQYDYNQTGFWLLQKAIEEISGTGLAAYIISKQFDNPSDTVFFSSDSRDIVKNRVTPYFPFEKGTLMIDHSYLQGTYAYAKNGLNINLEEFIKWDESLRRHQLLKAETMEDMWELFTYTDTEKVFTHGWDEHQVNGHVSYGFSGSYVTAYRIFPKEDLSIILLSNGLTHWYNIENIINHLASLVDKDITDVDNLLFESLLQASIKEDVDGLKQVFDDIKSKKEYEEINFETKLNDVGYMLLNMRRMNKAIDVFKLNTQVYPSSWNTYDSLAEAYEKKGDKKNAIQYYKKALQLNVANENNYNAKLNAMIERLNN